MDHDDRTRSWAPLPEPGQAGDPAEHGGPEARGETAPPSLAKGPSPAGRPPPARQWTVPAPVVPPASSPWGAAAPPPGAPPGDAPPPGYGPPAGPGYGPAPGPGYGAPPASPSPSGPAPGPAWSYGPMPGSGYGPPAGYGPPGAPAPAPSGRGPWVAFGLASCAVVAALVFLLVALIVTAAEDRSDETATADPTSSADASTTIPGGRLAPAPPIPSVDGPHEFFNVEPDGDPVAWDPCDPIHYVVNSARAPEGAMEILDDAIARVEQATGLVFVDEGATDEMAPVGGRVRPDSDPGRYGEGWSPVLISWTDAMADPELDGAAGLALPSWVEAGSGEQVYVTGYVEMAGDYAAGLIAQGDRDDVLGIMMHELGHLVGLGHVTPSDEVMTDDPSSTPSEWGTGDLVGLSAVGRGECEPDV